MPPPTIVDPATINCQQILYTKSQIYDVLPQKYEFAQLDGIVYVDLEHLTLAAYRDVREDEWWCRGHMPQQPIFPGVLMVESAAQLSAFAQTLLAPDQRIIMGFSGIDDAKFRDAVYPPARIIFIGKALDTRTRRFKCLMQAFANGKMAFEGVISGSPLNL